MSEETNPAICCGTCMFFRKCPSVLSGGDGECHRYPPTAVDRGSVVWPRPSWGSWCGEWTAEDSPPPEGKHS